MRNRIERLEENIAVLENIRKAKTREEITGKKDIQWSIRYGLLESIQIVIDISCAICGANNLGTPENYGDCVRKIAQFNYIPKTLESQLISMIGLRNLLVHEYAIIEPGRLYDFIGDLSVFREFIFSVNSSL